MNAKRILLTTVLAAAPVCWADPGEPSRTTKFDSPDQFVEVAKSYEPAAHPHSELGHLFSAPELGLEDAIYGQIVVAEMITEVKELFRGKELCAYFLQAKPNTQYTRTDVAALLLLRPTEGGKWRITVIERFLCIGSGGWIECKVIQKPKSPDESEPLVFRVTETDAGRRSVFAERVYTLSASRSIRLNPVNKP